MTAFTLGALVGDFVGTIIFGVIWLVLCKLIKPLRQRPHVSYGIALSLTVLSGLVAMVVDQGLTTIVGGFFGYLFMFWQYERAVQIQESVPQEKNTALKTD